jgi:hypothetical protein
MKNKDKFDIKAEKALVRAVRRKLEKEAKSPLFSEYLNEFGSAGRAVRVTIADNGTNTECVFDALLTPRPSPLRRRLWRFDLRIDPVKYRKDWLRRFAPTKPNGAWTNGDVSVLIEDGYGQLSVFGRLIDGAIIMNEHGYDGMNKWGSWDAGRGTMRWRRCHTKIRLTGRMAGTPCDDKEFGAI